MTRPSLDEIVTEGAKIFSVPEQAIRGPSTFQPYTHARWAVMAAALECGYTKKAIAETTGRRPDSVTHSQGLLHRRLNRPDFETPYLHLMQWVRDRLEDKVALKAGEREWQEETVAKLIQFAAYLTGTKSTLIPRSHHNKYPGVRRAIWLVASDKGVSHYTLARMFNRHPSTITEAVQNTQTQYEKGTLRRDISMWIDELGDMI